MEFIYQYRGYKQTLMLIPGWGSDYRFFANVALPYNYLLIKRVEYGNFIEDFLAIIKKNKLNKLAILGWSLGGFLASQFAAKYPQLITQLVLVGVRERYPQEDILKIEEYLKRNKTAFLRPFYSMAFSHKDNWQWFRYTLLENYCQEFSLEYLLDTLNYLKQLEIKPELLEAVKSIKFVHGDCDQIAPLAEAKAIADKLPQSKFIRLSGADHAPFMDKDFLDHE